MNVNDFVCVRIVCLVGALLWHFGLLEASQKGTGWKLVAGCAGPVPHCSRRGTNPRPPTAVAALQQWVMEQPSFG